MSVKLINGDCLEVLPTLPKADLILTDPPYNIGFKYNAYQDRLPDADYIAMLKTLRGYCDCFAVIQYPEETMRFVAPALGMPDEVIAWCYNSNIGRRFRLVSIYGRKPDYSREKQPYKNPNDKRVKKLIDAGSVGTNLYDWWQDIQLVKNVSGEKTEHPCPIPEKLAERLIKLLTLPGEVVTDPFAGGGTVPHVANRMGRVAYGIEIDPVYFGIAQERVNIV